MRGLRILELPLSGSPPARWDSFSEARTAEDRRGGRRLPVRDWASRSPAGSAQPAAPSSLPGAPGEGAGPFLFKDTGDYHTPLSAICCMLSSCARKNKTGKDNLYSIWWTPTLKSVKCIPTKSKTGHVKWTQKVEYLN